MRFHKVRDMSESVSRITCRATLHSSRFTRNSSGFTLVELLVVIAMLMLLAGAVTSSVASAQRRAKIAQATAEAQEMTNAIRAYEHFWGEQDLTSKMKALTRLNETPAEEGQLKFILGEENGPDGEKLPVLYNASIKGGKILDPWGKPYLVTVKEGDTFKPNPDPSDNLMSYVAFPNFNRRRADN